jgi:hypothetical protein
MTRLSWRVRVRLGEQPIWVSAIRPTRGGLAARTCITAVGSDRYASGFSSAHRSKGFGEFGNLTSGLTLTLSWLVDLAASAFDPDGGVGAGVVPRGEVWAGRW